jgi:hypothetical protein
MQRSSLSRLLPPCLAALVVAAACSRRLDRLDRNEDELIAWVG